MGAKKYLILQEGKVVFESYDEEGARLNFERMVSRGESVSFTTKEVKLG